MGKGLDRRSTEPATHLVAAWGSPPVVLRCGVPVDPDYQPGDQLIAVSAGSRTVRWFAAERDGQAVWSTPVATVHVEVLVPAKYQGADIIAPLTPAVSSARVL